MASLRLGFLYLWSLVKQGRVFEDPPLDVAQRIGKGAKKRGRLTAFKKIIWGWRDGSRLGLQPKVQEMYPQGAC